MTQWNQRADESTLERTIAALKENGIDAVFVQTGAEAKEKVLAMLPPRAEVMDMTSMTLQTISAEKEILSSGKYNAVRNTLNAMDSKTQGLEKQRLGAAPEWVVGSVHAVTEDGHVLIASNSGSQLPAYAYGAAHVILVVGTQKIVKDTAAGIRRIYEHSLPLESERAQKAYGVAGSAVNKLLIINKENQQGRLTMILVNEVLGF